VRGASGRGGMGRLSPLVGRMVSCSSSRQRAVDVLDDLGRCCVEMHCVYSGCTTSLYTYYGTQYYIVCMYHSSRCRSLDVERRGDGSRPWTLAGLMQVRGRGARFRLQTCQGVVVLHGYGMHVKVGCRATASQKRRRGFKQSRRPAGVVCNLGSGAGFRPHGLLEGWKGWNAG